MTPSRQTSVSDPALGAAQLLVRLGLALMAIGVPCGAVGSRRLIFTLMPVGAALVLIGGLISPTARVREEWRQSLSTPAALVALFLAGWMLLSLIWTPYVSTGGERFFKTVGSAVLAMAAVVLLPRRTKTSNLYLLPLGIAGAAFATLLVTLLAPATSALRGIDMDGSTIERAGVGLIMLSWPALAALAVRERWGSAGALAILVAGAAMSAWTPTAMVALALGSLAFALSVPRFQRTVQMLAGLALALFVLSPLIAIGLGALAKVLHANPAGPLGVFQIWASLEQQEGLRLLTGHGIDATNRGIGNGFLPSNAPRSILFEVWYDLGAVGAIACGVLFWRAFMGLQRMTEPLGSFMLAALVCGLTISVSGISTGQLWWVSLVSVVGITFGVVIKGQYRTHRPRVSQSGVSRQPQTAAAGAR